MKNIQKSFSVKRREVVLRDAFWSGYEKLIRETAIPYQWSTLNDEESSAEPSHAIRNFRIAAGLEKGEFYGFVFQDSDVYKWLEGVSYSLENCPNRELEELADRTIELIGKAQRPDGYLNTYFTIKEPDKRWTNLHECHELYCAGHMIEAAVAYFEATQKTKFLEIACKFADYIDTVFGPEPEKRKGYPGHPEIELALVRLYRATRNRKYLNLSRYFLEQRGQSPYYFDEEWERRGRTCFENPSDATPPGDHKTYNQTHLPVTEQRKAVGHAVRGVYLYTAMADVAAETGDQKLSRACESLWDNIVDTQLYITGGIGSTGTGEAFTFDYNLPNDTVYAETCASIGLVFFADRMLRADSNAKYADVIERVLYNLLPASVSMDGKHFFYVNPLEVWPEACENDPGKFHVKPVRQPWFGCACCPPNLVRLVESLRSYIYRTGEHTLYVNLYIGSSVSFSLEQAEGTFTMQSDYPWDGRIRTRLSLKNAADFSLALRVPGWCRNAGVTVNGQEIDVTPRVRDGYAVLNRRWEDGDEILLDLAMPVQLIAANPNVREDAGKVAIQRGPVIYCLEEADNGGNLSGISLNQKSDLKASNQNLFGRITVIEGKGRRTDESGWGKTLYRPFEDRETEIDIRAIPYFAWGNRGMGEMLTWIRWERI